MSRNLTRDDARLRVLYAKTGSLADASEEYLSELRRQLQIWLEHTTAALHVLQQQLARAARD